jgi:hypothetical protein
MRQEQAKAMSKRLAERRGESIERTTTGACLAVFGAVTLGWVLMALRSDPSAFDWVGWRLVIGSAFCIVMGSAIVALRRFSTTLKWGCVATLFSLCLMDILLMAPASPVRGPLLVAQGFFAAWIAIRLRV